MASGARVLCVMGVVSKCYFSLLSCSKIELGAVCRLTRGGVREGMTGWRTWPRLCAPGRSRALCARVPTKPEAECFSRPWTLTLPRHLLTNPRCPAPPSGPNSVRWALESAPRLPHDPRSWTGLPCPKPGQPAGGSLCRQLSATSVHVQLLVSLVCGRPGNIASRRPSAVVHAVHCTRALGGGDRLGLKPSPGPRAARSTPAALVPESRPRC